MSRNIDINDDEIRVIGDNVQSDGGRRSRMWLNVLAVFMVLLGALSVSLCHHKVSKLENENITVMDSDTLNSLFEGGVAPDGEWYSNRDSRHGSEVVIEDTVVNGVALRIFTPYNLRAELHVGEVDTADGNILLCTQAADVRRDNHKILGAFVYKGEPLAWGLSKRGYCAIINNDINVGVADNSPWFEEATERGGYFFRQYPLVDNGKAVINNPENSSIRRALCSWKNRICIIASEDPITMNAFSEMLANMGVRDAIYLVGSNSAHGWVADSQGRHLYFSTHHSRMPENINYILFRK